MKTKIELYVIDVVRAKRSEKKISQQELALLLNCSSGFIGKIESINHAAKYNLNHINKLALIFNCSPKDFLPSRGFQDD
jgi:transcriptional regulator with XRE-family HTH domain